MGIFVDWAVNRRHWRSQALLVLFRLAHYGRTMPGLGIVFRLPTALVYRALSELIFSVDIPIQTKVGVRLRIRHGFGLVVHKRAVIGCDVTLRHGVTIGVRRTGDDSAPYIGDGVDIGAHAIILGDITIGAGAVIAAGAVVLHDVPPKGVVVGNPARVVGLS